MVRRGIIASSGTGSMPIYEYKCAECGFRDEHLQKLGERPLKVCPSCGKKAYKKQLSAAGFQLKGSGWYATDFKGGGKAPSAEEPKADAKADAKPDAASAGTAAATSDAKPAKKAKPEAASA